MKKCFILLTMTLLTFASLGEANAEERGIFSTEEVKNEIRAACERFFQSAEAAGVPGVQEILTEESLCVSFTEGLLIHSFQEKGSLAALAGDLAQWRVPAKYADGSMGEIRLVRQDGKLAVAGGSWQAQPGGDYATASKLRAVIDSHEILSRADSLVLLADARYDALLLVAQSDGKEFVVPFSHMFEEAGIECGKVYESKQLIECMDRVFDEDYVLEHPEENGGVPLKETAVGPAGGKAWLLLLPAAAVIGIFVILTLRMRRRARTAAA